MKKILLLLSMMFFAIVFADPTATAPTVGVGSSDNPYEIGTLNNLYWIAADTLRWDKNYNQTDDINASGTESWSGGEGWTPIGYSVELLGEGNKPFTGSYEGQDYKISGLYINSSNPDGAALFGMTENADLLNIIMENVNITGDSAVAALVGWNFTSTITNCSSSGNVTGNRFTGGLIGMNILGGTIDSCYSTCTVTSNITDAGGLAGNNYFSSTVENCYSTGNVSGNEYCGGLIGDNTESTIEYSFCTGNVSGTGNCTGGLTGGSDESSLSNCYCTGNVAGIRFVGGLTGTNETDAIIDLCFSSGHVSGNSDIGGMVGFDDGDASSITNSFWNTQISELDTSDGGTGKTTVQMQTQTTYTGVGFDFVDDWDLSVRHNSVYPYFQWQTFPPEPLVKTQTVLDTTVNSAMILGDITSLGDTDPSQHGVCWNTSGDPDINDDKTMEGSADSAGLFTSEMTSLSHNTQYYVKAYATNTAGTTYGEEISFLSSTEVPTPITLASFTASAVNGVVELAWETATETNNARFVIYRDGEAIGSVDGAGTTSEPHNYSYVDAAVVPGVTYTYVLADVDLGNNETRYDNNAVTVTVANDIVEADFVVGSAYPNPFNPRTVISMHYAVGSNTVINIYNTQGVLVDQLINGFVEAGHHELTWNASNMPSGVYVVKMQASEFVNSQKIVLMK